MRKCVVLTLVFLAVVPLLAKDDSRGTLSAVDRRRESNDAEAITDLYDENAVPMPKQEGESSDGRESIRGTWIKKHRVRSKNNSIRPIPLPASWQQIPRAQPRGATRNLS